MARSLLAIRLAAQYLYGAFPMSLTGVSWYLAALFLFAAMLKAALTTAPGGTDEMRIVVIGCATLAAIFAILAIVFRVFLKSSRYYRKGWLHTTLAAFAAAATAFLLKGPAI